MPNGPYFNTDQPSVRSYGSSEENFTEMLKNFILDMFLKITNLRLQAHLSGANELKAVNLAVNMRLSAVWELGQDGVPCIPITFVYRPIIFPYLYEAWPNQNDIYT